MKKIFFVAAFLLAMSLSGFSEQRGVFMDIHRKANPNKNTSVKGSKLRPVLKCFKDSNFSGSSIFCITSPTGCPDNHLDYNLKGIGMGDKISSIGWVLVKNFSVFAGTDPEIPAHDPC